MGCVSSKKSGCGSPTIDATATAHSRRSRHRRTHVSAPLSIQPFGQLEKIREESENEVDDDEESGKRKHISKGHSGHSRASKKGASEKKALFSFKFGRLTEAEQVAAGWPAWLTAVAGEAVDGWLPLRSDKFERLEKIGQGTYSDVYRARDLETGKMVALKRVRFDNFQPESVRFMAREITILRKLDHPNVVKLEGIITSRLSCSIHLVFEYMEHDLAGLLSCPDIKFTDSQIKCYMLQLLRGLEHCHSKGIMHRDIKTSNILVNNEGILKIGDFGLANFMRPKNKQPLTSRVVTLWYRPPELLLGSTSYGETVDLWSVGCVFAELFTGRPLFKGRTEVEQLHKIFKLCGSPPEEYWRRSRLPLATMFKPQQPYESSLRQRCKEFPKSAVSLIETLLAIDPYKRGSASLAIYSEYFNTKPYACEPSRLPKYPPNKEIDAKFREDARRKKAGAAARGHSRNSRRSRKPLQDPSDFLRVLPPEEAEAEALARRNHMGSSNAYRRRGVLDSRTSLNQQYDTMSEASQATTTTQESQLSTTRSVPVQTAASGFAWVNSQNQPELLRRLGRHPSSRSRNAVVFAYDAMDHDRQNYDDSSRRAHNVEASELAKIREHEQLESPGSFDYSDIYEPQELDYSSMKKKNARVAFSGPLIQSQEIASRQYGQPRELHRSRFYQDVI